MEKKLSIIPLGGLEEIGGMNSTIIQYGEDMIVVDAGLMFPEEDMLGVDFVIPDFTHLAENRERLKGIFLTHGHEDHTGALPFLLKEVDAPVYGTPLTLGLVEEKLKEHHLADVSRLVRVRPRETVEVGPFTVEFLRVTHSIVDGVALGITTPLGRVVHTGDFKIDPTPVDGELLDFHKFTEYGEKGTLLLLSDSTNAENGGFTFSEKEVRRAFEDIFTSAPGRIIISTFASNIHRIQQAVDVAVMHGRKVMLAGRSIVSNARIAHELGYLNMPEDTWLTTDALKHLDDEEVVLITTGSQGEPMSVLSRIAVGEHKQIKIRPGDTVVLSAKMIPGNERPIGRIINRLFRQGADVIYEKVSEIHVSGHASKEELKLMMNMVRPRYFMPIHGEYRHLIYHSKLALKQGMPEENVFVLKNGEVLELTEAAAGKNGKVTSGRVFVDGKGVGDVEEMVLRDRRRLGHDGIVLVLLTIEKDNGTVISGPDLISRGFILEESSQEVFNNIRGFLAASIRELDSEILRDQSLLQAKIRSVLKKHFRNVMGRRPMIMPLIFEV
jgi:ribonuclease J